MKKTVLFLQGYDAGSHRAFLRGWMKRSKCDVIALTLPGYSWKWRMRHSGVSFANIITKVWAGDVFTSDEANNSQVEVLRYIDGKIVKGCLRKEDLQAVGQGGCVVGTSMVNMADFLALLPADMLKWGTMGCVQYFHENQFAYPFQKAHQHIGDVHFGLSQVISGFSVVSRGGKVIFNSAYNRESLLAGFNELSAKGAKLKEHDWGMMSDAINQRSEVIGVGIEANRISHITASARKNEDAIHFVWAGRWEHDKQPEIFFNALKVLKEEGTNFQVSVLGESFGREPQCFEDAKVWLGDRIIRWGYEPKVEDYWRALGEGHVFVSTANHEFFGLSVMEAAAAGCELILPRGLAYPEIWGKCEESGVNFYCHDKELIKIMLQKCSQDTANSSKTITVAKKYDWQMIANQIDEIITYSG